MVSLHHKERVSTLVTAVASTAGFTVERPPSSHTLKCISLTPSIPTTASSSSSDTAHTPILLTACSLLQPSTAGIMDRLAGVTLISSIQSQSLGSSPSSFHLWQTRTTAMFRISPGSRRVRSILCPCINPLYLYPDVQKSNNYGMVW